MFKYKMTDVWEALSECDVTSVIPNLLHSASEKDLSNDVVVDMSGVNPTNKQTHTHTDK